MLLSFLKIIICKVWEWEGTDLRKRTEWEIQKRKS